jgi:hypothetical protein
VILRVLLHSIAVGRGPRAEVASNLKVTDPQRANKSSCNYDLDHIVAMSAPTRTAGKGQPFEGRNERVDKMQKHNKPPKVPEQQLQSRPHTRGTTSIQKSTGETNHPCALLDTLTGKRLRPNDWADNLNPTPTNSNCRSPKQNGSRRCCGSDGFWR